MDEFRIKLVNVVIKNDWTPTITDHAVMRYGERVLGINVGALRRKMNTAQVRKAIARGWKTVKVDGCTFVICNGRVVTVLSKGMIPKEITARGGDRGPFTSSVKDQLPDWQVRVLERMKAAGSVGEGEV